MPDGGGALRGRDERRGMVHRGHGWCRTQRAGRYTGRCRPVDTSPASAAGRMRRITSGPTSLRQSRTARHTRARRLRPAGHRRLTLARTRTMADPGRVPLPRHRPHGTGAVPGWPVGSRKFPSSGRRRSRRTSRRGIEHQRERGRTSGCATGRVLVTHGGHLSPWTPSTVPRPVGSM